MHTADSAALTLIRSVQWLPLIIFTKVSQHVPISPIKRWQGRNQGGEGGGEGGGLGGCVWGGGGWGSEGHVPPSWVPPKKNT